MAATKTATITVEQKLINLYNLQLIDSKFDSIQRLKGELPMEVADLEDELEGLGKRMEKIAGEIESLEQSITDRKNVKKEAEALIEKYTKQQNNVKNNREFDALTKEIELQSLEIQISDKRIKEAGVKIEQQKEYLSQSKTLIEDRKDDLETKKVELEKIIKRNEKDEKSLAKKRTQEIKSIEERLMKGYTRIRNKYLNGLAVVTVERDACGGCYNSIPPQVQLEIDGMKRVIQCENCARILIPGNLLGDEE